MSVNWQWPSAIIFCVITLVLGGLIYVGKLPAETMGVLVAWLIPSPIAANKRQEEAAETKGGPS